MRASGWSVVPRECARCGKTFFRPAWRKTAKYCSGGCARPIRHGTVSRYKAGCRCVDCVAAFQRTNRAYTQRTREKRAETARQWRSRNIVRVREAARKRYRDNPKKYRAAQRERRASDPVYREHLRELNRIYKSKNKDRLRQEHRKWCQNNRERRKHHGANARSTLQYKIAKNLRSRLGKIIRGNIKAGSAVSDLGCSVHDLISHISKQFAPGMSWDNYGKWHLDHIRPLASFDLSDRGQFLEANHYTNLQPLWAIDNAKKGIKPAPQHQRGQEVSGIGGSGDQPILEAYSFLATAIS